MFIGSVVSSIALHILAFSIQQAAMFIYGSIVDHMFDGKSHFLIWFFKSHKKCVLYIKNKLVENISETF